MAHTAHGLGRIEREKNMYYALTHTVFRFTDEETCNVSFLLNP